jgi:hypothetical protein
MASWQLQPAAAVWRCLLRTCDKSTPPTVGACRSSSTRIAPQRAGVVMASIRLGYRPAGKRPALGAAATAPGVRELVARRICHKGRDSVRPKRWIAIDTWSPRSPPVTAASRTGRGPSRLQLQPHRRVPARPVAAGAPALLEGPPGRDPHEATKAIEAPRCGAWPSVASASAGPDRAAPAAAPRRQPVTAARRADPALAVARLLGHPHRSGPRLRPGVGLRRRRHHGDGGPTLGGAPRRLEPIRGDWPGTRTGSRPSCGGAAPPNSPDRVS